MSVFKNILDEAYEAGLAGNTYGSLVGFIMDKYPNLVKLEDFTEGDPIYEAYEEGYLEFEQESKIALGE